ncbi:non-ribosomal peptide synthetase [Methylosinus sp. LW4]|uniref:non-ribosomal peptide synthetase n=1 Tax=Methylosinus sp. LW4 TaxID=136993 RepID=UPI000377A93B|nr:non-ribosomal peptide synthetase [Methylosinus sp. LW4]
MDTIEIENEQQNKKARLSPGQRELLELRLRGRSSLKISRDRIAPRAPGDDPLSYGQERIWFQCQVSPNPALFNIALLARIEGALDPAALQSSLREIIRRHEVLRSGFVSDCGVPRLFYASDAEFPFERTDLCRLDEEAQNREVQALSHVEARKPFDLDAPPLMRATLLTLGIERHVLLLTIHHIIWDGWSSGLLIQEIGRLYEAAIRGAPNPLAPLSVQYGDFAAWHRRLMTSEAGRRQIDHWAQRLAGLPDLLALPTDRPRASTQGNRGSRYSWTLSQEALEGLTNLARRMNTTLFVVLLSAFKTLLYHYSGQTDIAVGTTIAYRTHPELERLVGFFANALVLRTTLDDNPSFETLLARVHETAVDAQSNQDAPFEMLVEKLATKRCLGHNPLFQVAFVHHNIPIERLSLSGLAIDVEEVSTDSAIFDLVLHVFNEAPGLRLRFEHDLDLFDEETIARMAAHFTTLVDNLLASPTTRIAALRLSDAAEYSQIVAMSEGASLRTVAPELIHHWIGRNARADHVAVATGDATMTYGELAVRANQIAHWLQRLGVGPDVPVGVLLEPSVELVAAIIGVSKAGGAFVPLDPAYPPGRIDYVLSDARAGALLTTRELASNLDQIAVPIAILDQNVLGSMPDHPVISNVAPENVAYIIYTSGSTGRAKGVMATHRNAVASTRARLERYAEPVAGFLLLSSISFDSSLAGLFWTLSQGGRLHIPSERVRRDPGALIRLVERESVTHLLCLPSFYSALLEVATPQACASLRCCVVAGETCKRAVVDAHFATLPHAALFNEYGPTECSVWSTIHEIAEHENRASPVSIGEPIPGARAYVVGPDGDLSAVGLAGELYIGGPGVTRGYHGQPELTAEKFVPDPFGHGGERLYRTGDRVKRRRDGGLEFLGRFDEQIKLRGYRVDPREIEDVLSSHPNVSEAVVVVRGEKGDGARLIGYVVANDDSREIEAALRRHVEQNLPAFMVPDVIVALPALPRLPNGKVDRSALFEPATAATEHTLESKDPISAVEFLLADIWRAVLGVEEIGRNDNFFDLGGNSLSAIQVVARAQQRFGKDIPITTLFEGGTLGELAAEIEATAGAAIDETLSFLLAEIDSTADAQAVAHGLEKEGSQHV